MLRPARFRSQWVRVVRDSAQGVCGRARDLARGVRSTAEHATRRVHERTTSHVDARSETSVRSSPTSIGVVSRLRASTYPARARAPLDSVARAVARPCSGARERRPGPRFVRSHLIEVMENLLLAPETGEKRSEQSTENAFLFHRPPHVCRMSAKVAGSGVAFAIDFFSRIKPLWCSRESQLFVHPLPVSSMSR